MATEPSAMQTLDDASHATSFAPLTVEAAIASLRAALNAHRLNPNPASNVAVRTAATRLAAIVELMPRHDRESPTAFSVLELARNLWKTNFSSIEPDAADINLATAGLRHGWAGIVAAMLRTPCWAWENAPTLEEVPDWLWGHYMQWVLTPPAGAWPGIADKYVASITDYIWELAGWMERNRGSDAVRSAGHAFLDHASSPLLLQTTRDLKPYSTARGRLAAAIAHTRSGDVKPVAVSRTGRPLRVGIIARNFADNADNRSLLQVVRGFDPARVELVLFTQTAGTTQTENAFRQVATAFHVLPALRADRLTLCASTECDVIVFAGDISRTTDEFSGLALQRLAPLQAVLPSNPFTTGLQGVDLRLVGAATAEPSTERLALLPGSGLAFAADEASELPPASRAEFGLPETGAIFVSAAHPDLMSIEILGAWSRLLDAVPQSSLVLVLPESTDPVLAAELPARVAAISKIDASRVVVSLDDSRRALSLGGVYLDTFPTSDPEPLAAAARAGMPSVAWAGATHRSRTGAALLRELGGAALVATDEAGYIARAKKLADDEDYRAATGVTLAASTRGSDSLAVADAITGLFERAFDGIVENTCRRGSRTPLHLGFTQEEIEAIRTHTIESLSTCHYEDAVASTRLWLQGEPNSADARLFHARALRLAGQNARALTYALAALTGNEDESEAWLEAAAALRANHKSEEAISAYEAALKLNGASVEAWIALSELASEAGHHAFASEAAKTARDLCPGDPRVVALAASA